MSLTVLLLALVIVLLLWNRPTGPLSRNDVLLALVIILLVVLLFGTGVPTFRPMFCR